MERKILPKNEKRRVINGFLASQTLFDDNIYPKKQERQYFLALFFSFFFVVLLAVVVGVVVVLFVACLCFSLALCFSFSFFPPPYQSSMIQRQNTRTKTKFLSSLARFSFFPLLRSSLFSLLHLIVIAGAATG
jgi:hypothetical protein